MLAKRLMGHGLSIVRQRIIPLEVDGIIFPEVFRADLVVENQVLVELKSLERLDTVHARQVVTYLRLSGLPVGLLLNFGAPMLRDGLRRFVNRLPRDDASLIRINRTSSPRLE